MTDKESEGIVPEALQVVGIGGSNRAGSTAEKALRIVLAAAVRRGARVKLISGPDLVMPLYEYAAAERSEQAKALVDAVASADGLILATPAYHGSISGMVKNALDYMEELRTDRRPYFSGRAVGCISVAGGWQASASAVAALRATVHALRGWPTPLGVTINTETTSFDVDGRVNDPQIAERLELVAEQVVEFALMRRALRAQQMETPTLRELAPAQI
ncbi:NADPH-dependent FMN reductase [Streptomyces sp. ME19-01-6]|uniref:NADPH-dependent FMN reductase n=1 Tax=Streptomyces sp. ME19-01-6 TaxID=3028686 RepID=UPI0029AD0F5F|nr:NADPH-dependent FMN reductase [Streptomyces sp. ME19-01-6]MDX3227981.1 NAD(P)H-dependent oxidoreductase [Streptomyces sp. ME19-01-6]